MKTENIHAAHRERMRKRYVREGIDNFAAHEIIELLLHYPIKHKDTNSEAHGLINRTGSFSGVFDASVSELCEVHGIGETSALFLKLIQAAGEIYSIEKREKATVFRTAQSIAEYCVEQYRNITVETYSVMLFDISNRVLGFEWLSVSSWRETDQLIKELGEYVFRYNADSFVIVRNSTDGNLIPTKLEMDACVDILEFFKVFNRGLSEYIVIGTDRYMPICKYIKDYVKKQHDEMIRRYLPSCDDEEECDNDDEI